MRLILIHFCITYTHITYLLRTTIRITVHAVTINTTAITLPVIAPAAAAADAEELETMYEHREVIGIYLQFMCTCRKVLISYLA